MPKVQKMDETEKLDADVLKGLFEQGVSVHFRIFGSGNRGNYFSFSFFFCFPTHIRIERHLGESGWP